MKHSLFTVEICRFGRRQSKELRSRLEDAQGSNGMQFVKEALCSELSRQLLSTLDIVSCLLEYPEGMLDHHRDRKAWCVKQVIGHLIEED
jgi:hypothetical protein